VTLRGIVGALLAAALVATLPSPAMAAPANDHFDKAQRLTGRTGSVRGSTVGATREGCEPVHAYYGEHTVWYRWKAPATGTVRIRLRTSGDVHLSAFTYRGGCFGSTDAFEWTRGSPPYTEFHTTRGRTYWFGIAGQETRFTLDYRLVRAPRPANDQFGRAQGLRGRAGLWAGTNAGATRQRGEPGHARRTGHRSLWFAWTAPRDGRAVFHTLDTKVDTILAVYVGRALGRLKRVAANDNARRDGASRVVFTATAGRTYRIALAAPVGVETAISDGLTLRYNTGPGPHNDHLGRARPIHGSSGLLRGWTTGARRQRGEPRHGRPAGGASVWFRWKAPVTRTATFTISETEHDPLHYAARMAVYTGSSMSDLQRVKGSRFDGFDRALGFPAVAGRTYLIALDGYHEATGSYLLSWWTPAANDDFAKAEVIVGQRGTTGGATDGATSQHGEPSIAGHPPTATVWFRWTAPSTGATTIDTYGAGWATSVGVFRGDSLATLAHVASHASHSGGSTVTFDAVAGTDYKVVVDSPLYAEGVPYRLNWRQGGGREFTPPTVAITGPAAEQAVRGTITVSASAGDSSGVAEVRFGMPEVWLAPRDASAPYTATVDTTQWGDGPRTLGVTAVDSGSNVASDTRVVVMANRRPQVWVTAAPVGATADRTAHLAWRADEPVRAAACSLDGGSYRPCDDVVSYTGLADGDHVLRVVVTDASGLRSYAGSAVWRVDTRPVVP